MKNERIGKSLSGFENRSAVARDGTSDESTRPTSHKLQHCPRVSTRFSFKASPKMASQHTDMLQQEGTFTCAVCLHPIYPFKQPVLMTFCEHVFCRACAEKQKTDEGKYRCGFCSQISDSFSILTAKGGLLSRLYNSTIMACPMGCGWTGEAVNHEAHYKSCARFKCEDCGAVILPPKKIDVGHFSFSRTPPSTGSLTQKVLILSFQEHRRDECTEAVLECCYKARGCLKRVKREHLARHEADCPKRPVTCSFLSCGFEVRLILFFSLYSSTSC